MQHSILIVEDEKNSREGLAKALSHTYKTFQAANGREAMETLDMISEIRVIVSDLGMPEVDGLELLEKVQTYHKKVDVIIVTASSPSESQIELIRRGAFDYMTKPVDLEILESTIQKAIENKKNMMAHQKKEAYHEESVCFYSHSGRRSCVYD
jgi:DNA-binding NtrC family response regulator